MSWGSGYDSGFGSGGGGGMGSYYDSGYSRKPFTPKRSNTFGMNAYDASGDMDMNMGGMKRKRPVQEHYAPREQFSAMEDTMYNSSYQGPPRGRGRSRGAMAGRSSRGTSISGPRSIRGRGNITSRGGGRSGGFPPVGRIMGGFSMPPQQPPMFEPPYQTSAYYALSMQAGQPSLKLLAKRIAKLQAKEIKSSFTRAKTQEAQQKDADKTDTKTESIGEFDSVLVGREKINAEHIKKVEATLGVLIAQSQLLSQQKLQNSKEPKGKQLCKACDCFIPDSHRFSVEHRTCYRLRKQNQENTDDDKEGTDEAKEGLPEYSVNRLLSKPLFPDEPIEELKGLKPFEPEKPIGKKFIHRRTTLYCVVCKVDIPVAVDIAHRHCCTMEHYENVVEYLKVNEKSTGADDEEEELDGEEELIHEADTSQEVGTDDAEVEDMDEEAKEKNGIN